MANVCTCEAERSRSLRTDMKKYTVYILKCSDKSYYTGVASNVEERLSQHQAGTFPEHYTFAKRPVELVFAREFEDLASARLFEKQVRGWNRKKKEAIINDEWDKLKALSVCQNRSHSDNYEIDKGFGSAQPNIQKNTHATP